MPEAAETTETPPPAPTANGTDPSAGDGNEGGDQGTPEDLAALRAAMANERKRREATQKELDDLRAKHMSESEKALAEARAEGRKAALSDVTARLLAAEVRAVAADKMADPGDAVHLLDLDGLADDEGAIDSKGILARIDALLKDKPYLAKPATPPTPGKPPQGARETPAPNGAGADDFFRQHVRTKRGG